MENIILGILSLVCIIITLVLLSGRGGMLVAGYNMLPKEKREKIDDVALSRFMGVVMIFITIAVCLVWLEISWLNTGWIVYMAASLIFGSAIFALIFVWRFKRFMK